MTLNHSEVYSSTSGNSDFPSNRFYQLQHDQNWVATMLDFTHTVAFVVICTEIFVVC